MNTREMAKGRWPAILLALGIPAKILDGKHRACPFCGGKDRFRLTQRELCFCNQCGTRDPLTFLMKFKGWDFALAAREVDKIIGNLPRATPKIPRARMTREAVAQIWRGSKEITNGDAAGVYLCARNIRLASWPKALHYVPRMWHAPSHKHHPCMLALFRSADDKTGTVHRTYLAEVEPRRMFVPFGVPKGGAIRLSDPELCMGVAEGIETALSASVIFKMPVWACANEGMLRAWQPPEGAKRITIFGDNDSSFVGQAAAYFLAWRLGRANYHVTVEIPMTPDMDWNDVLRDQQNDPYTNLSPLRLYDRGGKPAGESIPDARP
jgi:putative DNA primase/helicase